MMCVTVRIAVWINALHPQGITPGPVDMAPNLHQTDLQIGRGRWGRDSRLNDGRGQGPELRRCHSPGAWASRTSASISARSTAKSLRLHELIQRRLFDDPLAV